MYRNTDIMTTQDYNNLFEENKTTLSIKCNNGRTYFFETINDSDWMWGFSSKTTSFTYDEEKIMSYKDLNKYLSAVKRILKKQI